MASMTKIEKFQAKIDIEMDHIKASLIELRAKAKEAKLDARTELEKGLDALESSQVRSSPSSTSGSSPGRAPPRT